MELSVWLLVAIVSIFMYLIFIKNNEYLKIINNYAARINGLENEISNLKNIIEKLNISLVKKENEFTLFSSIKYDYPFPFWIKDTKGIMIFINQAYEKAFGVSKERYVGQTDDQIWGKEKAEAYKRGDEEARLDPRGYKVFNDECEDYSVVKWSHKIGETVIAYYGCCFPKQKN